MNDFPWKNNLETLYQLELKRFRQRIPKSLELHKRGKADFQLNRYQRLFMANRGVWEAIPTSGAAVSFVMTDKDIAYYLEVFERMLKSLGQARRD